MVSGRVPCPFLHNCPLVSWPSLPLCHPFSQGRRAGWCPAAKPLVWFVLSCLFCHTFTCPVCVHHFTRQPSAPVTCCHLSHVSHSPRKEKRTPPDPWAPDWSARVPSLKHFQAALLNGFLGTLQPCASWVVENITGKCLIILYICLLCLSFACSLGSVRCC